MQFGAIFSAVGACKKAVDVIKDVSGVPDQAIHLWRMVDALEPPLALASMLLSREISQAAVAPALSFCHEVLSACDAVLIRSAPDGRPYESPSWTAWWNDVPSQTRDAISRVQLLPQLIAKASQCCAVLQLALQTASMECSALKSADSSALARIGLHPVASFGGVEGFVSARTVLHLFEMGRLVDCSITSSAHNQTISYQVGQGKVYLASGRLVSVNAAFILSAKTGGESCEDRASFYTLHILDVDDLNALRGKDHRFKKAFTIIDGPNFLSKSNVSDDETTLVDVTKREITAIASIPLFGAANGKTNVVPSVDGFIGKVRDGGSCVNKYDSISTMSSSQSTSKRSAKGNRIIVSLSSPTDTLLLDYEACTVAGQFCYFPLGNERYRSVTVESFISLIVLSQKVSSEGKRHVDEVLPAFLLSSDDGSEEDEERLNEWATGCTHAGKK